MATENCRGRVKLVIRYLWELRDRALEVAFHVFGHPDVALELLPDGGDTIAYILPNGMVLEDLTRASALLWRILLSLRAPRG